MKKLHRLNAAQYYIPAFRKLTNSLFGKTLYNVVFGNNVKSAAFIFA